MIQIMEDCRSCFAAGQFADAGSVTEKYLLILTSVSEQ